MLQLRSFPIECNQLAELRERIHHSIELSEEATVEAVRTTQLTFLGSGQGN